ncbi:MAG: hypothetical protein MJ252_10565, partial [archaeon]|nr:hypothetical protein [archaeon]
MSHRYYKSTTSSIPLNNDIFAKTILNSTKHFIQSKVKFRSFQLGISEEIFNNHLPLIHKKILKKEDIIKKKEEEEEYVGDRCLTETEETKYNHLRSNFLDMKNKKFDNILTKKYKNYYTVLRNSRLPIINITQPNINNSTFFTENSLTYTNYVNTESNFLPDRVIKNYKIKPLNTSMMRFNVDLFHQKNYEELSYKEEEIFDPKQKSKITQFIINKYNELLERKTFIREPKRLNKTVTNKLREYDLYFQGIKIVFTEPGQVSIKPHFIYELPLEYIPIFYRLGFKQFMVLLLKIMRINPFDNKSIKVEENEMMEFLSQKEEKKKKNDSPILRGKSFRGNTRKKIDIFNECKEGIKESEAINILGVEDSDNLTALQKQIENTNIYKFIWLTPGHHFNVEISMPMIMLEDKKTKIRITKYVDYYLLFYLIEKKFENWDFYCLNYMFSFSKCREVVEKISSKKGKLLLKPSTTIEIKKPIIVEDSLARRKLNFICTIKDKGNFLGEIEAMKFILFIFRENPDKDDEERILKSKYNICYSFEQMINILKCLEIIDIEQLKYILLKFVTIDDEEDVEVTVSYDFSGLNITEEIELKTIVENIKKYSFLAKDLSFNSERANQNITISKEIGEPMLTFYTFNSVTNGIVYESIPVFQKMKYTFVAEKLSNWLENILKIEEEYSAQKMRMSSPTKRQTVLNKLSSAEIEKPTTRTKRSGTVKNRKVAKFAENSKENIKEINPFKIDEKLDDKVITIIDGTNNNEKN